MKKLKFLIPILSLLGNNSYSMENDTIYPICIRIINKNIKQYYGDGENFLSFVLTKDDKAKEILPIPDEGTEKTFYIFEKYLSGLKLQLGVTNNGDFGISGNVYTPINVNHTGLTRPHIFTITFQGDPEYSMLTKEERQHWNRKAFHFETNGLKELKNLWELQHSQLHKMIGEGQLNEESFLLFSIICSKYYSSIPIEVNNNFYLRSSPFHHGEGGL